MTSMSNRIVHVIRLFVDTTDDEEALSFGRVCEEVSKKGAHLELGLPRDKFSFVRVLDLNESFLRTISIRMVPVGGEAILVRQVDSQFGLILRVNSQDVTQCFVIATKAATAPADLEAAFSRLPPL
jgi:hypothetical protein